jgi:hypothetical protein
MQWRKNRWHIARLERNEETTSDHKGPLVIASGPSHAILVGMIGGEPLHISSQRIVVSRKAVPSESKVPVRLPYRGGVSCHVI